MAQLVIKGHHTRGNEVIASLEMLGGKNTYNLKGDKKYAYYTIDRDGEIRGGVYIYSDDESENIVSFTLEIFEDKFPYKVGDKVKTIYGIIGIVKQLVWSNKDNAVRYELEYDEDSLYFANELQLYKEETITIDDFKANTKEWLLDKLQSMSKENTLQTISNLYDELHKPKYPKTYEECCEMLNTYHNRNSVCNGLTHKVTNYDLKLFSLLETFRQLIVCRDAYWKIAGDELGLGKPWNPDYANLDTEQWYYTIITQYGDIIRTTEYTNDVILTFPTMEMRNAFYDNFKDLIEKCKELL